ncbi:LarC family nickel insertion protein [uncultured Anaerococcus sp.]|uniref:LarC family nickel insertion protein n=1 Tax=uncultured Anaerococcus sp. TaxID=293428 RepID=UPI0026369167|nr:LarC family nickel insertion protein [uncultured Anaerococcus sp.]
MDLYFEMYSGIAGDMTIGALLDLGASREKLLSAIDSLGIEGYDLVFERVKKSGIDAYNFDVLLKNNHNHKHDHDHHDHSHHSHTHRNLADIEKIISSSERLSDKVKKDALGIFDILAQAEALAHGINKNEVHFHEVGAVDSIIDIVGVCVLMEDLAVDNIYFSKLYEGVGRQKCAHGFMPIPVPAVVNILKDTDISLNIINEDGEHITPTGAAIVKYFNKSLSLDEFNIKKIGLGAGNKDFEKSTNILRIMEITNPKKKA